MAEIDETLPFCEMHYAYFSADYEYLPEYWIIHRYPFLHSYPFLFWIVNNFYIFKVQSDARKIFSS